MRILHTARRRVARAAVATAAVGTLLTVVVGVVGLAVPALAVEPLSVPGMAVGWGHSFFGELGNGGARTTRIDVPVPVCEPGASSCTTTEHRLNEVTAIGAGNDFGLALLQDGEARTWGSNFYGELGDGTTNEYITVPVPVCEVGVSSCTATEHHLKEVAAVAAGGDKTLAVLRNGEVVAWGYNGYGQLGDATTTGPECSVSEPCSRVPVPVCEEGASSCTASEHRLNEVAEVASGGQHSLALLKDGEVVAWGLNDYGQLGDGSTPLKVPVPVPVCEVGASSCTASEHRLKEVAAVAAGGNHSLALLKDGKVVAWGGNYSGQVGDGTTTGPELCEGAGCSRVPVPVCEEGASSCTASEHRMTEVAAVAAGALHSLALLKDGEVVAWGDNSEGQLGDVKTRAEQASSDVPVPVCEEGASSCTASEHRLKEVAALAGGEFHSLAALKNGGVVAWGRNFDGELGNGTSCEGLACSRVPVPVCEEGASSCTATEHRLKQVEAIAAGCCFSFAIVSPPTSPIETAEYKNWVLSGSITDKKQGQAITLPEGSTFNGQGEVNAETGAGSVSGNLSVPPFKTRMELFGVVPVELGLTVSQTGPLQGTVAKSETVPGDEALTIPLKLGIGITSLSIIGFPVPTSCTTTESASLALSDNLTRQELLTTGWSFAGAMMLPHFKCESGFIGGLLGWLFSTLLSGPENPYSVSIRAPGV